MKNPLTLPRIEPVTFQFVAQHLNHCATMVSHQTYGKELKKKNDAQYTCKIVNIKSTVQYSTTYLITYY